MSKNQLTNSPQSWQGSPASWCDHGRQDLVAFRWRKGKTFFQTRPKILTPNPAKTTQTSGKVNSWHWAVVTWKNVSTLGTSLNYLEFLFTLLKHLYSLWKKRQCQCVCFLCPLVLLLSCPDNCILPAIFIFYSWEHSRASIAGVIRYT